MKDDFRLHHIACLCSLINCKVFGVNLYLRVERDNVTPDGGRVFIQITYESPCIQTGKVQKWHGRKWYLSDYMIDDEIVKTCYAAYKAAVEHEVMEGFSICGVVLFNPHINYLELLKISNKEITR